MTALMLTGTAGASAQAPVLQPSWNQLSPGASPSLRNTAAITYDAAHGQIVMFGGFNGSYLNDTWLFNGTTWTQANPVNSPSPRSNVEMVYDPATGNVVLFGGLFNASIRYNDTWVWDGTDWTQLFPGNIPTGRASTSMVYDAATGNVVMFGGLDTNGAALGDTWIWNGTNWNQASPTNHPSARNSYAMAYDAAHSQVVLFGGQDGSLNSLNDTWTWNGTNWTSQSPSAPLPGIRNLAGMAYDPAQGNVVLFGGRSSGSNYLSDTWIWNGTNWTQASPTNSPSARIALNALIYDAAQNQLILFGGINTSDTWAWAPPQNFGSVNVCPSGQSTPAPCSITLPLTFSFAQPFTILSINVVTQGASGLDFTQANGGNCSGLILLGNSCTMDVTFTPLAPGLRRGAVQLSLDNLGASSVTTIPIYGVGQGPVAVFSPLSTLVKNVGTLTGPKGVLVDAAGDLFVSDYEGHKVVELGPSTNNQVVTIAQSPQISLPQGIAMDGAGNLYVADTGIPGVVKIPWGCTNSTCQQTVPNPLGLSGQFGVSVDPQGDLFVSSYNQGVVVEVPVDGGAQTPVYNGNTPIGTAVDAAGNLFVADANSAAVMKVPAGCTNPGCYVPIGSNWSTPQAVSLDAAGDLYVTDSNLKTVVEIPAGCVSSSCQITIASPAETSLGSGFQPWDAFPDGQGNIYIADHGLQRVDAILQQFAGLNFSASTVNNISGDSPQSVLFQNIGNQTLSAVTPGVAYTGPDFPHDSSGPDICSSTFSLVPGANCNVSISFLPLSAGALTGNVTFTDNALNNSSAFQTLSFSGLGVGVPQTLTVIGAGTGNGSVSSNPTGVQSCNILGGVASGTCSASFSGGTVVSLQEIPSSGYVFTGWGNACSNYGTQQTCQVTLNSTTSVIASFAPVAINTLSVTEVGTGAGTVSDNQLQINCSQSNGVVTGTCAGNYTGGTSVTLTATPSGNTIFAGWGGNCAGSGASATCNLTVNSALNVTASFVAPGATQPWSLTPITAGVVYGQGGSFTSASQNNGGVANGFSLLSNVTVDAGGNLYVADGGNNRVLYYPRGSTTPTRVYGQNGSFTSNSPNIGGAVSANGLSNPLGVVVDSSGDLYVADQNNNRVLFYPVGQTTPTRVYGQPGFNTGAQNFGGISASSLFDPWGMAVDASGGLYVADYVNSRVLYYPAGSTTATRVYGQNGSFTSNSANNGGVSADSLSQPTGVALDASGDLYVADIFNNRVLFYPNNSTTATVVYGQNGSFTSNSANNGGVSANSLNNPMALTLDSSGDLYVIDRSNNRLLFYPFGSTTATKVYGQAGSFTSATANSGGISANSLSQPFSVALDPSGNVYVTDFANNRVLEYGTFGNVNVCPSGQNTPAPCNTTITLSYSHVAATTLGATQVVTQGASGLDFTLANGGTCTGGIAAGVSCTVNVKFSPLAPGSRMGAVTLYDTTGVPVAVAPIYGIGQGPAAAFGPGTQFTLPATGLTGVSGVAVDAAGNVFISENAGAVKITPAGVQTTVPTTGISLVYDVAVDGAGNIYLADLGGNKVVKVTPSGVQTTVPATGLSSPSGVAVDGAGNLFITDLNNNRVVKITPSGVQTTVPASGVDHPYYPAVDAAGDVFFLNSGTGQVLKVTPGGIQSTIPISGLAAGNGVAVDAAGDVFVSDQINNVVLEVSPSGIETTVPTTGLNIPAGLAVDAVGNLFIAVNGQTRVVKVNRSLPPSLNFALTNVGSTSSDSPQIATLQNVGNQPLSGTATFNSGTSFSVVSTCGPTFSLLPGFSCSLNFGFSPQSTGYLTGSAVFSDNTMNLSPAVSLETISLGGIGGLNGQAVTAAVPNVVGFTQSVAGSSLTGAGLVTGAVSTASSSIVPSGSVIASNPAAGTQVSLGSSVKLLISSGRGTTACTQSTLFAE